TLGNLAGPTGSDGSYILRLTAAGSGIADATGNPLAADASDAFVVDTTPPTAAVVPVVSDPRTVPVGTILITFSEPVTGFGPADLTNGTLSLTRDGVALSLAGATPLPGALPTWTLGNLAGPTGPAGRYVLTLIAAGSGIIDA